MKYLILIIMLCNIYVCANAQSIEKNVIASGGTTLQAGTIQLENTIGETFTNSLSSASNSISQGFHQPNIIVARIGLSDGDSENENPATYKVAETDNQFYLNVYPNPAIDYVNVRIKNSASDSKFKLMMIDETGKLIRHDELTQTETQIDFTKLAAGKYFINVVSEDGNQKESFKVVKLN